MKTTIKMLTLVSFVLLAGITITACKDDEGDTSAAIEGKWKGTQANLSLLVLSHVVREEQDDDFDADVEFKTDKSLAVTNDGVSDVGTWKRNGNFLEVTADLNVPYLKSSETLTIEELTATNLELYIEKDTTYKDPDSGISITGTLAATLHFQRASD